MADTTDYNGLSAFFADLINRFVSPTPAFFNVLTVVGVIIAAIGFIPVVAPAVAMSATWAIVLKVTGIVVGIISRLPVKNTAAVASDLPFTVKNDGVPASKSLTKVI